MASLIRLALEHFPLSLLLLGVLLAMVSLALTRRERTSERIASTFLRWFLLCSVGLSFFVNFVFHSLYGDLAARWIGWAPSPFQYEVGTACLGFALVGVFAAFGGLGLRLAAVLGPTAFLWGAAIGHGVQPHPVHDDALGNVGAMLGTDILVPLVGFALLAWQAKAQSRRSVFARSRL
ncbi:MAG: hypothetical protein HKL99_13520 [Burkholderiales bacterium]|jgi:hypothetical protein|nr:hypothetical protein [Burkholderiales bacterium]